MILPHKAISFLKHMEELKKILKQDKFTLGIVIGILNPLIIFGILYFVNVNVDITL